MSTYVLGIDPSKTSTGWYILHRDAEGKVQTQAYGAIRGSFLSAYQSQLWPVVDHITTTLKEIITLHLLPFFHALPDGRPNVLVAIESPIYDGTQAGQQYYIFQEILRLCQSYSFETVSFSAAFVKAFAKNFHPNPPRNLDKDEMRVAYDALQGLNPFLPPHLKDTSDVIDAFFLALILTVIAPKTLLLDCSPFLNNPNLYLERLKATQLVLPPNFNSHAPLTKMRADLTKKEAAALSPSSSLFYPFGTLRYIAQYTQSILSLKGRLLNHHGLTTFDDNSLLQLHQTGKVFIDTLTRRTTP